MNIAKLSLLCGLFLTMQACGGGGSSQGHGACSRLSYDLQPQIAGGESCNGGQANVAVILMTSANGVAECTGSYISLNSVLTAAHCFSGRVNKIDILSLNNRRSGVQLFIHPLYDGSINSAFDMAIVKVNQPLGSAPVPILMSRDPQQGEQVVAYGYGLDEHGNDAGGRIESGQAPLRATYTTFAGYSAGTALIISTGAGSTCPGDSGGPVLAKGVNGEFGIIGITRAGPLGCSAEPGRPSALSSTQSNGAINFISAHVPDFATN